MTEHLRRKKHLQTLCCFC